jgi:hypothetical protein
LHRIEAERLHRQAAEHEKVADEHAARAEADENRGERARQAAARHDGRASEAEERLEQV